MTNKVKNNLRIVRQDVGMSVTELAKRTGTSRQTITNIELHGQDPSATLALLIAKSLNKDPYVIFFTNDVMHDLRNEFSKEVAQ